VDFESVTAGCVEILFKGEAVGCRVFSLKAMRNDSMGHRTHDS